MEKTVLSKEEITQLSSLQQQQDNFVIQLGQIEYQKNLLEEKKQQIKGRNEQEVTDIMKQVQELKDDNNI